METPASDLPARKQEDAPKALTFPIAPRWEEKYTYQTGFGNQHATEAVPGALPVGQNTPQNCPMGLYAEQMSGTAFTVPRDRNERTWYYRITPSVAHTRYEPLEDGDNGGRFTTDFSKCETNPSQRRWNAPAIPADDEKPTDFVQGLVTICGAGSVETKAGVACHMYVCNKSMENKSFYNSDGDFLIVPQTGALDITTECGKLFVHPGEICVIPRGIQFSVAVTGPTRGYICECFTGHFRIPDLGPIGANGLANPRDFKYPVAWYEDRDCEWQTVGKYIGSMWTYTRKSSPFNVVAWHGNYAPFKYNLDDFNTINSVSYDHIDPSIFTVLTVPSGEPGVAAVDFAIFPPRYMVQENTFRPPYYHKNVMSEYMGLIRGVYEVKVDGGFVPGGGSLHNPLSGHGPDAASFERATSASTLEPAKLADTMAFMFESTYMFRTTEFAKSLEQPDYAGMHCWQDLKKKFTPPKADD